jgi:hypothetical protein
MKRSVISAIALTAAMMLSGGAFAQDTMAQPTMIGGQAVSEADLPKVQAQCNTLAGVENESLATETTATEGSTEPDGAGDLGEDSEVPNGTDQATTTVDLALITIEECKAAGLAQ